MNKSICLVIAITAACGNSSRGSELTGQVKKVIERTPLVCPDYTEADVSLGVMRNGTGSMSHEDVAVVVEDSQVAMLQTAARTGALVRITYDERRVALCWPDRRAVRVELADVEKP